MSRAKKVFSKIVFAAVFHTVAELSKADELSQKFVTVGLTLKSRVFIDNFKNKIGNFFKHQFLNFIVEALIQINLSNILDYYVLLLSWGYY